MTKFEQKIPFWNHKFILMQQVGSFVNQISLFLKIWSRKVKGYGHHMTKYGQNCSLRRLIQAVLSIFESLRFKDQRPSSTYDQIWAKLQIHNSIQCTRWQLLSMIRTYWGSVKAFLKIWGSKVEVIRWPNMDINAVLELSLYFKVPCSNICQLKTLIGAVLSIFENLRSKYQRSRSLVGQRKAKYMQFWSHMHSTKEGSEGHLQTEAFNQCFSVEFCLVSIFVSLESWTFKWSWCRPMCDLGILKQPAGRDIPSMLQRCESCTGLPG